MVDLTNTGGVKEFSHSNEDMARIEKEDTKFTKEFKAALYAKRFFEGKTNRQEVEKHIPFSILTVKVIDKKNRPVKHHIDIGYDVGSGKYRHVEKEDILGTYTRAYPSNKYKIMVTVRYFLFFKKKIRKFIDLSHDMEEVIIV